MNIKSQLFISTVFSHSVFGSDVSGKGARLDFEGTAYLLGETTASVDIGLIAREMNDSTKWFAIPLAE